MSHETRDLLMELKAWLRHFKKTSTENLEMQVNYL